MSKVDYSEEIKKQRTRDVMSEELYSAQSYSASHGTAVANKQVVELLHDIRDMLADMREWLPTRD
jgi:hypothetical protein